MNNDRFKFRVWDAEKRAYRYDCEMSANHDVYAWEHMYDRCICEQCTGLRDKNGKLIYEGDIVKGGDGWFTVEWYQGKMVLCKSPYCAPVVIWDSLSYEIVGNIHEEVKDE